MTTLEVYLAGEFVGGAPFEEGVIESVEAFARAMGAVRALAGMGGEWKLLGHTASRFNDSWTVAFQQRDTLQVKWVEIDIVGGES